MANILIVPLLAKVWVLTLITSKQSVEQLSHKQTVYHYFATAALNASFQLKLLLIMPK
jgi:hypothetical protein